ncbi:MAG: hypothetical protein F6J93_35545 [Oscillatoria sp. SIO1A7]|nr:hypothetical protein [Oscillatoria sp. SIO1A7]
MGIHHPCKKWGIGDRNLGSDFSNMAELIGDLGPNLINGTIEADLILGLDSNDTLTGAEGNDNINGNRGDDIVGGGDGADSLFGGKDNDTLDGEDGNDTLSGDLDDDILNGGNDDDLLVGGNGNDTLNGNSGDDNLFGLDDNDFLFGGLGDDFVNGNAGNDRLDGQDGADTLRGGRGDDTLNGGTDSDILFGDRGEDTLSGGSGSDFFVLQQTDGTDFEASGADLIVDYNDAEDFLVLDTDLSFDLLSLDTINQVGPDNTLIESAVISLASNDKVIAILQGVARSSINESDFLTISGDTVAGALPSGGEGNDTMDADEAVLNSAENLDILTGTITRDGTLDDDNPVDIYSFTLSQTSGFTADLDGLTSNADIELIQDFNGNGQIDDDDVINSDPQTGTNSESIAVSELDAGTYFVRVFQVEGSTDYDLTLIAT